MRTVEELHVEEFSIPYVDVQYNLGNVYRTLAEAGDKGENCKRARKAHEEALKVFTKDEEPEMYAQLESKLGELSDFCGGK